MAGSYQPPRPLAPNCPYGVGLSCNPTRSYQTPRPVAPTQPFVPPPPSMRPNAPSPFCQYQPSPKYLPPRHATYVTQCPTTARYPNMEQEQPYFPEEGWHLKYGYVPNLRDNNSNW